MKNELNKVDEFVSNIIENAVSIFYSENKRRLSEEELRSRFIPNTLTENQFERGYEYFMLHRTSKYPN